MLDHRVSARKDYSQTEAGRESHRKSRIKYSYKYPNAYKAKIITGNAIRDGKIIRSEKCEECSSNIRVEGHHDDYNKPLDVRWLCCKCHNIWHKNNTPLNRETGIFTNKK